jgi:hypothetical protein
MPQVQAIIPTQPIADEMIPPWTSLASRSKAKPKMAIIMLKANTMHKVAMTE